jgi:cellulose biosynthesis protein BcsQ
MPVSYGLRRETIDAIQEYGNSRLAVIGVVVNRVTNTREAQYRIRELTDALSPTVLEPDIPMRSVIAEAMGAQQPITAYLSRATDVTAAYRALLDHARRAAGMSLDTVNTQKET